MLYMLALIQEAAAASAASGKGLGLIGAGLAGGLAVLRLQRVDARLGGGHPGVQAAHAPQATPAAAGVPTVFLTSYYALHAVARLAAGERLLVHSATGGVGLGLTIARDVIRSHGGDITLWSSYGDLDAGRGARSALQSRRTAAESAPRARASSADRASAGPLQPPGSGGS